MGMKVASEILLPLKINLLRNQKQKYSLSRYTFFPTAQLDTVLLSCFEFWENISSNKGVLPFCNFWSVYKLYKTPPFIDLSI